MAIDFRLKICYNTTKFKIKYIKIIMAAKEEISQDLIAPWLGTPAQKKAYEAKLSELENFITKQVQMTKGTHYLMHDMRLSAVTETRKLGEWVYISFISIKKEKQVDENLKMLFEARAFKKLRTEDPENPKYINKSIFVKLGEYAGDDVIEPSRAGGFVEDEIAKVHNTRIEELKEIFYLLHLPIVPNVDQDNLDDNWLVCNQKDDRTVERNLEILLSLDLLAARRIDNAIPGNISIGLTDDIPKVLQILKSKPAVFPEILLGDEACENAKWVIRKYFRDVKFQMPVEVRSIGVTPKWAVDKKVDEIVETLCHYGMMAINCDSSRTSNFVIMQTKRAVYELKSRRDISYTDLVSKLSSLESAGKLDELPEDFASVVPFNFKNSSAGAIKVSVSRKKHTNHADVYSLIFEKLGIHTYNQKKPLMRSVKISNGKAPNKEGKEYQIIRTLKCEKDLNLKQAIIDTLCAEGYDSHFVGEEEGAGEGLTTICFYPEKKDKKSEKIPELEATTGVVLADNESPMNNPSRNIIDLQSVKMMEPILKALLEQLSPEAIKMLVIKIPALKPETPEPKIVDKTTDNLDKLLKFYKFILTEKSDAYNSNYFATKDQILKTILSEDK